MHIDGNEACEAWRHCSHLSRFNHDVASSFFGLAGSCKAQPARTRIIRNTQDISRPCLPARIIASRSTETQLLRRDCSRVGRDCLHTQLQPYTKAVLDSLTHLQPATSPCKLFGGFIRLNQRLLSCCLLSDDDIDESVPEEHGSGLLAP